MTRGVLNMVRSAGAALGAFTACGEGESAMLPQVSWSSEDFEFATDWGADKPLCGGTLDFQQRFVDLAQAILGEPVDGQMFTYYLFTISTFNQLIGSDVRGRYSDGNVFAQAIPNHHEVTHAVVDLSMGSSHTFFNEGIAEVFHDRYGSNRTPGASVEAGLEYDGVYEKLPESLYGRAGHFMSYALDIHGVDATVDLLALARPGDTPEVLRADMVAAFGMPYEDLIADYANYPFCAHSQFRWPITECAAGALIPEMNGVWLVDVDLDCSREDMLGPRVVEKWTVRTIEIPKDGSYRISVSGEDGDIAFVELGHCSPGCAVDKGVMVETRDIQTLSLRQGRYHLTSVGLEVKSGHLNTRIENIEPGV